jgi:hypothetical protein
MLRWSDASSSASAACRLEPSSPPKAKSASEPAGKSPVSFVKEDEASHDGQARQRRGDGGRCIARQGEHAHGNQQNPENKHAQVLQSHGRILRGCHQDLRCQYLARPVKERQPVFDITLVVTGAAQGVVFSTNQRDFGHGA